MKNRKTVVLIPALNPNEDFITYVKDLKKADKNIDVVVIDDGSKKEKKYIFEKIGKINGCVVLTHAVNLGKGRGLKTGFNYFINNYPDDAIIITADSDGQHTVKDVLAIADNLKKQGKDKTLILGVRDFNLEQVPFKSRNGNKITTCVFKLLYGKKISDTQTGLRGLSYEAAKDCITLDGERFEYEINMLIYAVNKKINIIEQKIETVYFDNNSETHFNPIKDSFKIYRVMFGTFFKFLLSSISSAVIDLLIFTLVFGLISKFDYTIRILVATIVARILSSLYNYFVNRNVVFKDNKKNSTIVKYYILCAIQLLVSWLLVDKIGELIFKNIHPTFIKSVVDFVLFLISYQIQRRWVFRSKVK